MVKDSAHLTISEVFMLYKAFTAALQEHRLLYDSGKILLAISGGADSMCLLHLMQRTAKEFGVTIYVCHVQHNMRTEAINDEMFVAEYCQKADIPYSIKNIDVPSYVQLHGMSTEDAARQLRYQELYSLLRELGCEYLFTAHNKNDQAETFLINMLRGAAISGLSGMRYRADKLVRPLIDVSRSQIEAYCQEHQLAYCQDMSNFDPVYTRNKVRLQLLPYLAEHYNPNIVDTLVRNMKLLQCDKDYLSEQTNLLADQYLSYTGEQVIFDISKLSEIHIAILQRLLLLACSKLGVVQGIAYRHIELIMRLAEDNYGSKMLNLPRGITVQKVYDKLIFAKSAIVANIDNKESLPIEQVLTVGQEYNLPGAKLIVSHVRDIDSGNTKSICYIPQNTISGRLILRKRMAGDYFLLPDGKRKKLKDFFIDIKLAQAKRDQVPIISDDKGIIWVVGYRHITRTVATPQDYIKIEYKNGNIH